MYGYPTLLCTFSVFTLPFGLLDQFWIIGPPHTLASLDEIRGINQHNLLHGVVRSQPSVMVHVPWIFCFVPADGVLIGQVLDLLVSDLAEFIHCKVEWVYKACFRVRKSILLHVGTIHMHRHCTEKPSILITYSSPLSSPHSSSSHCNSCIKSAYIFFFIFISKV